MKQLAPLLLALIISLPLYAESFMDFRKRRLKELMDDGHNKREAMKIIHKEWKKRDTADNESTTNAGNGASDAPAGNDLESLETEWRKKLEAEGLPEKELEDRLKEEMKIQKKLVKLEGAERDKEFDDLHRKDAKKIIDKLRLLKDYPSDYAETLIDQWDKWYWKSDAGRKNWLTEERDKIEDKEIKERKARGFKVREQIRTELKQYWTSKGLHQKHKAAAHFSSAWEVLIGVPRRLYEKEKSTTKLSLKRNGFDSKATGIFFDGMDALFEAPR